MKLNDRLGEAKIVLDSEKYTARMAAIDALENQLEEKQILDLAEYLFQLTDVPAEGWFSKIFIEHDPTFTVKANAREIRILSAQLLENHLSHGNALAGLVAIAGYAMNMRTTSDESSLYASSIRKVSEISSGLRNPTLEKRFNSPAPAAQSKKLSDSINKMNLGEDLEISELLSSIYKSGLQPNMQLKEHSDAINTLANSLKFAKEESSILWWHISEWCNTLGQSHRDLKSEVAAVFLPFDVVALTVGSPAPNALPALFKRALGQRVAKLKAKKKQTIFSIVDSVSEAELDKLSLEIYDLESPGLFPLIFALKTAKDLGVSGNWSEKFEKETGLSSSAEVSVIAFAMQLFTELDVQAMV